MHVGAAGEDVDAGVLAVGGGEALGQQARAGQGALLALLELLGAGDLQGHGLGGDGVHQRPALLAREDGGVELLGVVLLGQDHAGAGAAEGLVHGGGHDVGRGDGRRVQARGDQAGEVGHVGPQLRANLVGDGAERVEVQVARVRGPAGDDDVRLLRQRLLADLVHVDAHGVGVDAVGADLVELAGEVQLHAVGQVAAVGQVQAQDAVAGVDQRVQHRGVGLGAGVRLDVGEFGAEELLGAVAGEVLDDVDVFAAAVVAAARVAFGVLVGQHRTLRLQDGAGDEVLAGDHFQGVALAGQLAVHRLGDGRVEVAQGLVADVITGDTGHGWANNLSKEATGSVPS